MKLNLMKIELERQYPSGMHVHAIREECMYITAYVKAFLEKGRNANLFIAAEYIKTLNNKIGSNLSLYDIDELAELEILNTIYN
jgi:hypothetical protein